MKAEIRSAVRAALATGSRPGELLDATRRALDEECGGLVAVVHLAGEAIPGVGQLCTRCGMVLTEGEDGRSYPAGEGPLSWPDGAEVWEVRRWGEPTNPRAMGVVDPARRDPDERPCAAAASRSPEGGPDDA